MAAILEREVKLAFRDAEEARTAMSNIASGKQNDVQIAAFLSVYNMRMPTADELTGFRNAMLELAVKIEFPDKNILDIVGTGGDGKDTFNISTLASLVCAASVGLQVVSRRERRQGVKGGKPPKQTKQEQTKQEQK